LSHFVEKELLPGLPVSSDEFWQGAAHLITTLTPRNQQLLHKRDQFQSQLDEWHQKHPGPIKDPKAYHTFLSDIGYVVPDVGTVRVQTDRIDHEISTQAGPQLVVPASNARYALNAANARWGSLYDALYGTDVIDNANDTARTESYNPQRGAAVIKRAKAFLDDIAALQQGSHADATQYAVHDGQLVIQLNNGQSTRLSQPTQCVGFKGQADSPDWVILKHNQLHVILAFDRTHDIGSQDLSGLKDIILEAALTTIMDLEDSVAAVDASDKVASYRNLLGLFKGELSERIQKGKTSFVRRLAPDITFTATDLSPQTLPGRALMFIRNVGHLMTSPAITFNGPDHKPHEVPEGIMDALITTAIAQHDLLGNSAFKNSRAGSIYIVKPKMHGPEEVQFTCDLFEHVERILKLSPHTVKIGIMDEERRTSVNLKACLAVARHRVAFINTGFLDRTGDEIHTAMHAGPMIRKNDMKTSAWLAAYEKLNVWTGLSCGLQGRAQIGKGMWAMPDLMKAMMEQKMAHPKAGANTAWVPSPTAATLHALHYHQVNVHEIQKALIDKLAAEPVHEWKTQLLTVPVAENPSWSTAEIQAEVDNNAQGILGYVVRWIDQGIGCSKVPDIHNVGLMEDRATLRISSQHIANWLAHNVISQEQVIESFKRMAKIVDQQNAADPAYQPMSDRYDKSNAFQAALDLVLKGQGQPNGYTEPLLHAWRLRTKKAVS
jgi:malate synthase